MRHDFPYARSILLLLAATLVGMLALPAFAQTGSSDSPVSVTWTDPHKFSDNQTDPIHRNVDRTGWIKDLAAHVKKRAARRLPPGDHLAVVFTDIQRAGRIEPWRGPNFDDIRIVKDIYPPSIELTFTLTDASGKTIATGTRKLRDIGFLTRAILYPADDPLKYEKRLLDDWINTEFPPNKA